jgi:TonB family protein
VKTSPIALQRATADTIEVPLNVLQGLAVSEEPIVAPQDAPQVGVIALKLLVSSTGDVEEAASAKGDASLRQAAQDGAMRWKYRPYLVNGEPREFESTILIRFTSGIGTRITAPPPGGLAHPPMGGKAGLGDTQDEQISAFGAGGPVRVSSGVAAGLLSHTVAPAYPLLAKAAHVQGIVILHAILSKQGEVEDLQVVSGPPMLIGAAEDAVRRWQYKPFLLNGVPTEVETTINVNFTFAPPPKPVAPDAQSAPTIP